MMEKNQMKATGLLKDDDLEKVSGGTGNDFEEVEGFRLSPRASWCPHCQQDVEPDSLGAPHMYTGFYAQLFGCEKCGGTYIVKH